jgi:hypothetical protein
VRLRHSRAPDNGRGNVDRFALEHGIARQGLELMMHKTLRDDLASRLLVPVVCRLTVILAMVLLTASCAFWFRFGVLEDRAVGLWCRQGSDDWLCLVREAATFSYEHSLLGSFAVAMAAVNLVRRSYTTFAVATVAATIGAVLYNVGGAGIAITLIILSLARRERETVRAP